jgi:hypothetical protein
MCKCIAVFFLRYVAVGPHAPCSPSYYRHVNLNTRLSNQQTQWSLLIPQNAIIFKPVQKIPLTL